MASAQSLSSPSTSSGKRALPKKKLSAPQLSLPAILSSRETCPFRPTLKKDMMDTLVNGYYMMNSDGEITDLYDQVTSIQTDPTEDKLLLYGTMKGRLKICSLQESDYTKEFICSDICSFTFHEHEDFKILHSQWYPIDSGMFCFVQPKGVHIFDTNQFDEITRATINDEQCQSCDWNSCDPNMIAVATRSPRVKLYDLRSNNSLSSITVSGPTPADHQHNANRLVTRVYWSPMDSHGLFVGDSIGDIFFYDTRRLKYPLGQQRANDHSLFLPVVYIGMTPDLRHLITAHYNSCAITQWQFQPKRNEMLRNTNVNYQAIRKPCRHKVNTKTFMKLSLLPTLDRIYAPNLFNVGPDVFSFNRTSGLRQMEHELSHPELRRPVFHVTGFRRTKYGDDPNPALIYTSASQIVVSRMLTHAEPFDLAEEQRNRNGRAGTGCSGANVQPPINDPRNPLQQDRWSDSD